MVHVPLPPEKIHRGGGFRMMLLVLSIGSVLGSAAGLISVAAGQQEDNTLGPSLLPRRLMMLAICGLLNVGFTTGVWGWRRWGVYGIVCVSLFSFMLNWKIGGAIIAVPGLIAPVLLAAVAGLSWAELE